MCLAVPGRVVEIGVSQELLMGKIDFGGVVKQVCLDLVPEVELGDYVLVHVGFALARVDEAEAERMLSTLADLSEMLALEGVPAETAPE